MFCPGVAQRLLSVSSFHHITCSVPTRSVPTDHKNKASLFKRGYAGFQRSSFLCVKREAGLPPKIHGFLTRVLECFTFLPALDGDSAVLIMHLQYQCFPEAESPFWHIYLWIYVLSIFIFKRRVAARLKWVCCPRLSSEESEPWAETDPGFVREISQRSSQSRTARSAQPEDVVRWWASDFSAVSGSMLMLGVGEPVLSGSSCWSSFWELWGQQKSLFFSFYLSLSVWSIGFDNSRVVDTFLMTDSISLTFGPSLVRYHFLDADIERVGQYHKSPLTLLVEGILANINLKKKC